MIKRLKDSLRMGLKAFCDSGTEGLFENGTGGLL